MDLTAGLPSIDLRSFAVMLIGWIALCALLRFAWRRQSDVRWGIANIVTFVRATMTIVLAGLAVEVGCSNSVFDGSAGLTWSWTVTLVAALALSLDGVDGALARAFAESSRFGARFDMETDAFLALVLAVFIWRSGELASWILVLGSLRYLFVAASACLPALRAELFPSFRRKLVCVIQISALCLIVSPLVEGTLSIIVGIVATIALIGSFASDVTWLLRKRTVTA